MGSLIVEVVPYLILIYLSGFYFCFSFNCFWRPEKIQKNLRSYKRLKLGDKIIYIEVEPKNRPAIGWGVGCLLAGILCSYLLISQIIFI